MWVILPTRSEVCWASISRCSRCTSHIYLLRCTRRPWGFTSCSGIVNGRYVPLHPPTWSLAASVRCRSGLGRPLSWRSRRGLGPPAGLRYPRGRAGGVRISPCGDIRGWPVAFSIVWRQRSQRSQSFLAPSFPSQGRCCLWGPPDGLGSQGTTFGAGGFWEWFWGMNGARSLG